MSQTADYITTFALEQAARALRQRTFDYEERIAAAAAKMNAAALDLEEALETDEQVRADEANEEMARLAVDLEHLTQVRRRSIEAHEEVMGVLSLRRERY